MSEMTYIACNGARSYVEKLQEFYDVFAYRNDVVREAFPDSPLMQRETLYRALGYIESEIDLHELGNPHRPQLPTAFS
jgi:hypothetical protein